MNKVVSCLTGLWLLTGSWIAQAANYADLTATTLPSMQQVQAAALRELGLDVEELSVSRARIRASMLLPEVELRLIDAQRNSTERIYGGSSVMGGPLDVETERRVQTDENSWPQEYGVFFSWDLSKLLFHEEEIDAMELKARCTETRIRASEIRYKFLEDLTDWYFELKELLLTMETEKAYAASPKVQMNKEKLACLLDSLTGNLITRSLANPSASASSDGE